MARLIKGSKIIPTADRVVLHMIIPPDTTLGGIILPESAQTTHWGIVIETGDDVKTLKKGDKVYLPRKIGEEFFIREDDEETLFWVVPERNITVVIDESNCDELNGLEPVGGEEEFRTPSMNIDQTVDATTQQILDQAGASAQKSIIDPTAQPGWMKGL